MKFNAFSDLNRCSSNPCQHNGLCTPQIDMYTCDCSPGYTGVNCESG